uniref:(northern house mosquito) hypothetical protein n=1 Tax=Culex pipiens TaxID=7175 RepID=A0A8D8DU68_CULPI
MSLTMTEQFKYCPFPSLSLFVLQTMTIINRRGHPSVRSVHVRLLRFVAVLEQEFDRRAGAVGDVHHHRKHLVNGAGRFCCGHVSHVDADYGRFTHDDVWPDGIHHRQRAVPAPDGAGMLATVPHDRKHPHSGSTYINNSATDSEKASAVVFTLFYD